MERPIGTIDQPTSLPIKKIVRENENVKTFYFEYALDSKPGQFAILWIPRVDEKPFSVAFDENGELAFSIANVGRFTEKLFSLREGDLVGVRGPYGSWFPLTKTFKNILLVGGGYGVAPLAMLAAQAAGRGISVDFCNGARTAGLLLFNDRLRKITRTLLTATDDGSEGHRGFVTDLAQSQLTHATYDCVYVCGPEIMEKKVADACQSRGVQCYVSIERYMKCGFGVCGQCCIDGSGKRMCTEGPVVAGSYALQLEEFGRYHRDATGTKRYYHGH